MSATPKFYHVTPSAATETDLVATIATGYNLVLQVIQIAADTTAAVSLKFYNGSGTLAQTVPLNIDGGDTVAIDSKYVVPAGGKLTAISDQADTAFAAHGVLMGA
ncbi:MAG: hypothetical protein PHQ27_02420 [Victivallales bacterium]|nr:hypothetical protein [Victivallales bacterium]